MARCPNCGHPSEGRFCTQCGHALNKTSSRLSLPAGTVLRTPSFRYRLERVLGQGGFGVTYAAQVLELKQQVAIKEYLPIRFSLRNPDKSVSPKPGMEREYESGVESFSHEAQMLASLRGFASVVRVHDWFRSNGTAYLVMEFLEGVPLHQKAAQMGGRIPAGELLPRCKPLMQNLAAIHRQGVLHRDITPDNIMWMPDGRLKLLDFGSARTMNGSKSMTVLLKQGFAPVEQYLTHGQGTFTDVYALCATLYYCLTGVSPVDPIERLENDTLAAPIGLGVALTPEENAAILHGMAIQPKLRTQTVDDLIAELFPAAPPPPPPPPRPSFLLWLDRLLQGFGKH